MRPDKVTRQTLLQLGDTAYAGKHRLPDDVRRAVWAMVVCRTAVLGGHLQACPDGHVERIWYHACRHRMCPQGAWVQIDRWLAKPKGRLLAGEPDHVICTMPHELKALWLANVEGMSGLWCARGHDTRVELLGDRTYVGATPGLIATRQT